MKKRGWMGSSNAFRKPMKESVENAVNIVSYHLDMLIAHQGDGVGFMNMMNDFKPEANNLLTLTGKQIGDKTAQKAQTADAESAFGDMAVNLDIAEKLTQDIHPKGTLAYNLIWGDNRNRFYEGSYQQVIGALTGLSNEMITQAVPLGSADVLAYITRITTSQLAQKKRIASVGTDSVGIKKSILILSKKLNKNKGWLTYNYGDDDNCQAEVNVFLPLNLLSSKGNQGHYQLLVPKGDFRKICIHTFNEGETVDLVIGDADVWISTADNADSPISSGYRAIAGSKVTVNPSVFGDLEKKYIIATSISLTITTDVIFNIIAAPKA